MASKYSKLKQAAPHAAKLAQSYKLKKKPKPKPKKEERKDDGSQQDLHNR